MPQAQEGFGRRKVKNLLRLRRPDRQAIAATHSPLSPLLSPLSTTHYFRLDHLQFADPIVADRAGDGIDRSVRAANGTGVVQIEVLLDEYPIAGSGAGSYIVGVDLRLDRLNPRPNAGPPGSPVRWANLLQNGDRIVQAKGDRDVPRLAAPAGAEGCLFHRQDRPSLIVAVEDHVAQPGRFLEFRRV